MTSRIRSSGAAAVLFPVVAVLALPASSARGDSGADAGSPVAAWPIWVWVDGRPLGAARDAAAEAAVVSQFAANFVRLFASGTDAHARTFGAMGESLAKGEGVVLAVRFEEEGPAIQGWTGAEPIEAPGLDAREVRPAAAIAAHRSWASAQAPDSPLLFEVFTDVNALRQRFSDSPDDDRLSALLRAAGLANARSIMLHGRLVTPERVALADPALPLPRSALRVGEYRGPPLLRVDVSWNSRADDLRTVRGMNIAAGHWPGAALGESMPDCTTVAVVRWPWCVRLDQALDVRGAWVGGADRAAFQERAKTWRIGSHQRLDRVCGSLHGWLIVGFDRGAPGLLRLEARVREDGATSAAVATDVQQLIGPIAEDVSVSRGVSVLRWPAGRPFADLSWTSAESGPRRGLVGALRLAGCTADGPADTRRRAGK